MAILQGQFPVSWACNCKSAESMLRVREYSTRQTSKNTAAAFCKSATHGSDLNAFLHKNALSGADYKHMRPCVHVHGGDMLVKHQSS